MCEYSYLNAIGLLTQSNKCTLLDIFSREDAFLKKTYPEASKSHQQQEQQQQQRIENRQVNCEQKHESSELYMV